MNIGWSEIRRRMNHAVAHAFAVNPPQEAITPEEDDLAERLARFIVNRDLTAPAVAALESSRPYNFLGSQFLTFMSPFVHVLFRGQDYDRFVRFLEKRRSVDHVLDALARVQDEH